MLCLVAFSTAHAQSTPASGAPSVLDQGSEVVLRALSLLGVNYRWGGNTPETGLDCSGMVRHVFRETMGLVLPRRSEEMSRSAVQVPPSELRPGDLVFFNTLRRTFSHVGIYIGNNQFVHAPSTGGAVRVESLDKDYWLRRFDGARRVLVADAGGVMSGAVPAGSAAAGAYMPAVAAGATPTRGGRAGGLSTPRGSTPRSPASLWSTGFEPITPGM